MDIDIIEFESKPNPTASLIILHGLGADGRDFVPFCETLRAQANSPIRFVLPSAPVMPVTVNGGHRMRAWYDIRPTTGASREDETTMRASHQIIDGLIDREIKRGMPSHRIVLMGFSQGCAMALMAGLRQPHKLAGIIGLSGYVPLIDTTQAERHAANQQTPIFMAHGHHDHVVPFSRGKQSCDHLRALGYEVEWHEYPIHHEMSMQEVRDINTWLNKVLG